MSRIQAGVLKPRRSLTQVSDLVASVTADLGPSVRGHPLTTRIAAGLPPVDVDTTLICRVLTNLVQNAIRHSPKGAPITVSAALTEPDTIEVSVTDQGSGVSPSRRDEIFTLPVAAAVAEERELVTDSHRR